MFRKINRAKEFLFSQQSILLALFCLLNLSLYACIVFFHTAIPFHKINYLTNAHHFLIDPRIKGGNFSLLHTLGQYDAQWYLEIASNGYSSHPSGLMYAFFPFYPGLLFIGNVFIHNIELTAFLISILLILINLASLVYILPQFTTKTNAWKTIFLLFAFPYSIFYHSYTAEGVLLFLLLWFSYFFSKRNFLLASLCLSLLFITKATVFLLPFLLLFFLIKALHEKMITKAKFFVCLGILILPIVGWASFCYIATHDFLYFLHVRTAWNTYGLFSLFHNMQDILLFPTLPLHSFHASQIEVFVILLCGFLLFISKKHLPSFLWWMSFLLWIGPLLVTDTMSFPRYQSISFPLFLYLAEVLPLKWYLTVEILCFVLLCVTSLFFVNWFWIG